MKTYLISLLVQGGILALGQGEDSFLFTQCECLDSVFFPTQSRAGLITEVTSDSIGLACPTDATLGVIRDFDSGEEANLQFTLLPEFFVVADARVPWFIYFDISIAEATPGETYSLAAFDFPKPQEITVLVEADNVVFSYAGSDASVTYARNVIDPDRFQVFLTEGVEQGDSTLFLIGLTADSQPQIPAQILELVPGANVIGEVDDFVNNVAVSLLNDNGNTGKILLRGIGLDNTFLDSLNGVFAVFSGFEAAIEGHTDFDVEALPVLDPLLSLSLNEDEFLANLEIGANLIDSTLALEFDFEPPLKGTLSDFNATDGSFLLYEPLEDDFGTDFFNFIYNPVAGQVPYECAFSVSVAIEIIGVEDQPVLLEVDQLVAFGFVDVEFGVAVATSVDFPDFGNILQEGSVIIESLPNGALKAAGCVDFLQIGDSVNIVDGNFNFCFRGIEINGGEDSFSFSVRSQTGIFEADGVGLISILGADPVVLNEDVDTRSLFVFEDSGSNELLVDGENFFNVNPEFSGGDLLFGIVIVSLPDPSVGVLTDFFGEPVEVSGVFFSNETLFFEPADDFFNANAVGGSTNDDGEVFFVQDCNNEELIGEICPDTFQYNLFVLFDDSLTLSEDAEFGLVVQAVNDENPSLDNIPGPLAVDFDDDEAVNFLFTSTDELLVSNDNGNNLFAMGVRFLGNLGALIQTRETNENDPTVTGFNSLEDAVAGTNPISCVVAGCVVVEVVGTPDRVNSFLSELVFAIPNEPVTDATVSIALSGDGLEFGAEVDAIEFIVITNAPTANPTENPSLNPTVNPTFVPTGNPTFVPTGNPTTPSPTLSPTVEDEALGVEAIAGIAVGGVFVLGALIAIPLFLSRRSSPVGASATENPTKEEVAEEKAAVADGI